MKLLFATSISAVAGVSLGKIDRYAPFTSDDNRPPTCEGVKCEPLECKEPFKWTNAEDSGNSCCPTCKYGGKPFDQMDAKPAEEACPVPMQNTFVMGNTVDEFFGKEIRDNTVEKCASRCKETEKCASWTWAEDRRDNSAWCGLFEGPVGDKTFEQYEAAGDEFLLYSAEKCGTTKPAEPN